MTPDKNKTLGWLPPALLCFAVGLAAAAVWDVPINLAIYTPGNLWAVLMECFGWYPAFLPALFLAALLMPPRALPKKQWWRPAVCLLVFLGGWCGLYYASYGAMAGRALLSPGGHGVWVWLAAGVLFAGGLAFFAWRVSPGLRKKLVFFALAGTVFMLANQLVVYSLKTVWGRVRFDDMLALGGLEAFTPWYRPFGPGGSSFPSGHTANAAGIFSLLFLCDVFPLWNKRRWKVLFGCWGWVGAMALARMVIGRHFLSDTLAAAGLTALVFYALRHNRWYREALDGALKSAGPGGGGGCDV